MTEDSRRLAWITDPHLNFVSLRRWDELAEQIRVADADALLITGDISEAEDVVWRLSGFAAEFQLPVHFVLGNHDFYRGSIAEVRSAVNAAAEENEWLHYLTGSEPIHLGADWVLCGEDGWADARLGDYFGSPVRMNDFLLIEELRGLSDRERWRVLKRLGAESALRLAAQLNQAKRLASNILVLTHVPPFRESCWYDGKHSDDDWAPFFTCYATGWCLRRFCAAHPAHRVLVLCGHTHGGGVSQILPNLTVWTGATEYGEPSIAAIIDLAAVEIPTFDWTFE